VEATDSNGETSLVAASSKGHAACVRLLLEAKANLEAKDSDGETSLVCAAYGGHIAVLPLLIEAKANVEAGAVERRKVGSQIPVPVSLIICFGLIHANL
jgi:ankyrin repeat protein